MEINSNNINFKANRVVSITKFVDAAEPKYEKFDIYKMNENDIPFMKKVFVFLEKRKNALDGLQKQLHEQFKKILNDRYYFSAGKDKIYLGIKDDNYITGFLTMKKPLFGYPEITNLCTSRKNSLRKDAFIYASQKDSPKRRVYCVPKIYKLPQRNLFSNIEKKHSDYHFESQKSETKYNLEEVLGI